MFRFQEITHNDISMHVIKRAAVSLSHFYSFEMQAERICQAIYREVSPFLESNLFTVSYHLNILL